MSSIVHEAPVLSVSALTQALKSVLEGQFRFVVVEGEVSNSKLQTSGHFYFSLKDAGAQVSAVMFKADLSGLTKLPKDGDHIVVKGSINVYPPSGKYQIVVRSLELAGLGALLVKLEQLKVKLKEKGYFDSKRKKTLPTLPRTIGIVTSPTGAAIQDILNVLGRRFAGVHIILNPVKVQGEGAAEEIAAAIDFFNTHAMVDVMIVGRGGGSVEDLWAFNEEVVANAIFRSKIPIISAVGHETDHCIADYVADFRAPTPSAAAEMVIAERSHQQKLVGNLTTAISQSMIHLIRLAKEKIQRMSTHPAILSPYFLLGPKIQQLDELRFKLDRRMHEIVENKKLRIDALRRHVTALEPTNRIRFFREKINFLEKALFIAFEKNHERQAKQLSQITSLLQALDPKNVLSKGYTLIFSEIDHSVIKSVCALKEKSFVRIQFFDGEAHATVDKIEPKN